MKLTIIAAATAFSATIVATSPAMAADDCIDTLSDKASALAADQIEALNKSGETAEILSARTLRYVCSSMDSVREVSDCSNAMKEADSIVGRLDVLDWDLLRAGLVEYKNHGTCEGNFAKETLPKSTPADRYNPAPYGSNLLTYLQDARQKCEKAKDAQCLVATAQAAIALKVLFNDKVKSLTLETAGAEEDINDGIETNNQFCDPLLKLPGTFEVALKPTLKHIANCVAAINYAAYGLEDGRYSDIVRIAYKDVPSNDPTAYALREISGIALELNRLRFQ